MLQAFKGIVDVYKRQAMNRSLLLRLLQQNKVCSRANLAEQSGLKQATITNIISDLISWGIVEETGLIEGCKGRRAIGIRLRNEGSYVIGVRISRKYFEIGIFTPVSYTHLDVYKRQGL